MDLRALACSIGLVSLTLAASSTSAQAVSAEIVITEPGADAAVPPPPPAADTVVVPPPATSGGAVYAPAGASGSVYVTPPPSNAVYVPPGAPAFVPAEVPRERRVIDWPILGSGIGLLAGGWVLTIASTIGWYSATTNCTGSSWSGTYTCTHDGGPGGTGLLFSFIPVVGPWLMLTDEYLDTAGEMVFPVIAGLVQDVGLILLIVGLATMHNETVMEAPRAAGDVRVNGGASPGGGWASLDVVF